jgi:hypothetical protein
MTTPDLDSPHPSTGTPQAADENEPSLTRFPPLYATVNDHGRLRILRVPIARANERFFVLAAPYPLPNGTNRRIFNRSDPIIPDTPLNAARYYLSFLVNQRQDNELMVQLWQTRIAAAEKLLAEVEAGHDVLVERH